MDVSLTASSGDIRGAADSPAKKQEGPARLTDAARQFESLMLSQLLKSMREEGSGWLGTGDDQSGDSVMGMAEEQLAQALSSAGCLGFSRLVVSDLNK